MQYEIKDTVGFPIIANVDTPLRSISLDGTASTLETISAGQRVGFSSGISKEIETATKGTITIVNLQDDGWGRGETWVDLAKVYFTTDFGFGEDEVKHSVKGSANFDKTDTEKVTPKIVADNNTTSKEARDTILKGAGMVIDILTGKPTDRTKPAVNTDPDFEERTGIDWQPIIKWGLISLAVLGAIALTVYLVKDKPSEVEVAQPKNDVPTLQGVHIPVPLNLK